jgi:hypothetical protein
MLELHLRLKDGSIGEVFALSFDENTGIPPCLEFVGVFRSFQQRVARLCSAHTLRNYRQGRHFLGSVLSNSPDRGTAFNRWSYERSTA